MQRRLSRPVQAGKVQIGGDAPISVQSMTNTDTADVEATVSQILRLQKAGCELVRVSVYSEQAAGAIREIKKRVNIPLIADIHFDYRLALRAMENGIDKLRINPGNIGDRSRVHAVATAAKARGIPIRIGVNAGSLQKDIFAKHGGVSSEGMVESALAHAQLLEAEGFEDIVISLKASSVQKTVEACRLLAQQTSYPLHLGVTEAGLGNMAAIKAAAGIGALLLDGIGDTIRVSITGDPVQEVRVGWRILQAVGARKRGIDIVACPTCARTGDVPLAQIVAEVKKRLPRTNEPVRLAIMGCAVNGPGEAADADIGIAFGPKQCVLFEGGKKVAVYPQEAAVDALLAQLRRLLKERKQVKNTNLHS